MGGGEDRTGERERGAVDDGRSAGSVHLLDISWYTESMRVGSPVNVLDQHRLQVGYRPVVPKTPLLPPTKGIRPVILARTQSAPVHHLGHQVFWIFLALIPSSAECVDMEDVWVTYCFPSLHRRDKRVVWSLRWSRCLAMLVKDAPLCCITTLCSQ